MWGRLPVGGAVLAAHTGTLLRRVLRLRSLRLRPGGRDGAAVWGRLPVGGAVLAAHTGTLLRRVLRLRSLRLRPGGRD